VSERFFSARNSFEGDDCAAVEQCKPCALKDLSSSMHTKSLSGSRARPGFLEGEGVSDVDASSTALSCDLLRDCGVEGADIGGDGMEGFQALSLPQSSILSFEMYT
jgi:hypothetical protein